MPYRFLDSNRDKKTLINRIEELGFKFMEEPKSYRQASLTFERVWNQSEILTINWLRSFVSDGEDEEDTEITIVLNKTQLDTINIDELLKSKLDISLNKIIVEKVLNTLKKAHNKA